MSEQADSYTNWLRRVKRYAMRDGLTPADTDALDAQRCWRGYFSDGLSSLRA